MIVEHRETGDRYVLVGTGFGAYKATKPNWFFGNLMANEQSRELSVVAGSNADGGIGLFQSNELLPVSIDGQAPDFLLGTA